MALASVHTDINIHFRKNNFTNDVSIMRDAYSIRQSLINLIMTIPGEKPFRRGFGTRINDSLFEHFNYVDSIGTIEQIKHTIRTYEPRIQLEQVIINDTPITSEIPIVPGHSITASQAVVSDANQLFIYISYFLIQAAAIGSSLRDSISIGITKAR
jgi:phage baseplate assembly protein W